MIVPAFAFKSVSSLWLAYKREEQIIWFFLSQFQANVTTMLQKGIRSPIPLAARCAPEAPHCHFQTEERQAAPHATAGGYGWTVSVALLCALPSPAAKFDRFGFCAGAVFRFCTNDRGCACRLSRSFWQKEEGQKPFRP